MAPPLPKSGLFVGADSTKVIFSLTRNCPLALPTEKGNLIRELAGFVPYEKRITELFKVVKDKRVLKVAKRKLGTHKRAKKKREEMATVLRKMRSAGMSDKKK
ncbi:hypothetical protein H6P81_016090 [Aristolochia fimbriata]|uniref:60S ribosomal protein L36 n=1 Tax=Aristolochia fimbriata TaxID=158543 RepID=A0AAV7E7A3_ARIFI|nr:hypothetical protein H6P81_016090 [Aristolochia fimbriata]